LSGGTLLLVAAGYLAGSIPFGYLAGRLLLDVDVRAVGSGNIGATNVARAGGRRLGIAVLLLDAAKAIVPILIARRVLGAGPEGELGVVAVAVAAFAGHLFPVWLGFRGGKGVATGFGIFAVLSPWGAIAGGAAYGVAYAATRISSVGSLAGTAVCVIGTFVVLDPSRPTPWAGLCIGLLILLRHRDNVRRLLSGEEGRRMKV